MPPPPLAALLDGQPNGTEQHQLEQFEAEVERNVGALRELKAANEAASEAAGELIAQACEAHEAFEHQRAALAAELARLGEDLRLHGTTVSGSCLVVDGETIQLSAYSRDDRQTDRRTARIARPSRRHS